MICNNYILIEFLCVFKGASTQTHCTVTVNCCGWPICWSSTQSPVTLKPQLRVTIQAACRDARSQLSLQRSSTVVRPFTHKHTTRCFQTKMKWWTGTKLLKDVKHLPTFTASTWFCSLGALDVFEHVSHHNNRCWSGFGNWIMERFPRCVIVCMLHHWKEWRVKRDSFHFNHLWNKYRSTLLGFLTSELSAGEKAAQILS